MSGKRFLHRVRVLLDLLTSISIIVIAVAATIRIVEGVSREPGRATVGREGRRPAAVPGEAIPLSSTPMLGSPLARVGIVMFSDFQCPFCGKFAAQELPNLIHNYVDTGKVLLSFRHLPLENVHPAARAAAVAAACAAGQDQFWRMHDILFASQRDLDRDGVQAIAAKVPLQAETFDRCLKGGEGAALVDRDVSDARRYGIAGTPTFFIGAVENGGLKAVARLSGVQSLDHWRAALEPLLSGARSPAR